MKGELKLLELRRYAIDKRVSIKFRAPGSARECVINPQGQIKIPTPEKDFRVEEVFAAAQGFEITGQFGSQQLTRDEMAEELSQAFKQRGVGSAARDED